ncbi:MAG: TldD/PmbA family protein, partial [Ignavibacteria bacterium]|nr:TldD/PmbA family protein [Ignavibacteria bacterium]
LTDREARRVLEKVISYSKADSVSVTLSGTDRFNMRFAVNSLTTNGYEDGLFVQITSNIGFKTGSVSINRTDDNSIHEAVRRSEDIARLSPDNKEFVPPPVQEKYLTAKNYSAITASLTNSSRVSVLSEIIGKSKTYEVDSAGYYEDNVNFTAILNSNGLFAYNLATEAEFSATSRTRDKTGSSRVQSINVDFGKLNFSELSERVVNKARLSANPKEIKPGRYTVILEPAAVSDMVSRLVSFMSARAADEGRSFFSEPDGNKLGKKILPDTVNIYSDPSDELAPDIPFTSEGYSRNKVIWFENGILRNLHRNAYWAAKTSQPLIPYPSNLIMKGTSKTLDEIISDTDYAVLVTRLWYIRTVENKTMLLTGLTRDGAFEVRDGKITNSVKNFRFNESPVNVLSNIIDIGKTEKASGSESGNFSIAVPPLKVANFNFSSLSDAV